MNKVEVHLDITSWVGISIGATHSYGELHGLDEKENYKTVRLKFPMTAGQAKRMNKKERFDFPGRKHYRNHQPGEITDCFETKEQIIEQAKSEWLEYFPHGEILYLGRWKDKVLVRRGAGEGD